MATSSRASPQSSHTDGKAPATRPGSPGAPSSFSGPLDHLDAEFLAIDACDEADSLRELLSAYTCIEKLVQPVEFSDTDLNPTGAELSALVRVVNEEMERRIDSIDKTLQSMRSVLEERLAVQSP
jgi:hypothetical protein